MLSRASAIAMALGLGLALPAVQAADDGSHIFKSVTGPHEASKSKKFVINPELGRAWVEVDFYYDRNETSEQYRVPVPGLRYDRERSEVVFDGDGRRVVCATVEQRGWWIFRHDKVEPTGDCQLTHRYVKVPVDNGYGLDHVEHFEVQFKPAPGSGNAG